MVEQGLGQGHVRAERVELGGAGCGAGRGQTLFGRGKVAPAEMDVAQDQVGVVDVVAQFFGVLGRADVGQRLARHAGRVVEVAPGEEPPRLVGPVGNRVVGVVVGGRSRHVEGDKELLGGVADPCLVIDRPALPIVLVEDQAEGLVERLGVGVEAEVPELAEGDPHQVRRPLRQFLGRARFRHQTIIPRVRDPGRLEQGDQGDEDEEAQATEAESERLHLCGRCANWSRLMTLRGQRSPAATLLDSGASTRRRAGRSGQEPAPRSLGRVEPVLRRLAEVPEGRSRLVVERCADSGG